MNNEQLEAYLAKNAEVIGPERMVLIQAGKAKIIAEHAATDQAAKEHATQEHVARIALENAVYERLLPRLVDILTVLPSALEAMCDEIADKTNWQLNQSALELVFKVVEPGLAPILLSVSENGIKMSVLEPRWFEHGEGNPPREPEFATNGAQFTRHVDVALAYAVASAAKMDLLQAEYRADVAALEAQEAEQSALMRAQTARQLSAAAERVIARAEGDIEAERIIAWTRSDPAVLNLVRAFIAIEEGRQSFEERLEQADASSEQAWSRCERRSKELHEQIAEARREADLQRDLAQRYEDEAAEARRKAVRG
jgi:hypothetical protein